MNILNNKNKRISIFKTLALCLFAAVSLTLVSCDDDMDIQQSYPDFGNDSPYLFTPMYEASFKGTKR